MDLLTPDIGLIFWQTIIFLLLFLLLAKFAWKPIITSLKDRERSIQEALDTADPSVGADLPGLAPRSTSSVNKTTGRRCKPAPSETNCTNHPGMSPSHG